jgi:hypothetical protein
MIPKPASQIGITIVASSPLVTDAHVLESVAKHVKEIMISRLHCGDTADLRIGVMPDTSPESEADAVWHTYKQPEK